jgi:hypothetical protein
VPGEVFRRAERGTTRRFPLGSETVQRRFGIVADRVQANSISVGAAWLWCIAGCLGSWYLAIWLSLELMIR